MFEFTDGLTKPTAQYLYDEFGNPTVMNPEYQAWANSDLALISSI